MISFGLKVALIGMGTVFIALVALMLLINLQSTVLAPKPKKAQEEPPQETIPVKEEAVLKENQEEDQIAAVIAAAIAAYGGGPVIIKTITPIKGTTGSAWAASGRSQAMNLRQI